MDRSLRDRFSISPESTETTRNSLSLSPIFEPYVPGSHHDILETFRLLNELAEVARMSLRAEPQNPKPDPKTSQDAKRLAQQLKDKTLLEALEKIRASRSFKRRSSGMFTTIIRPQNP